MLSYLDAFRRGVVRKVSSSINTARPFSLGSSRGRGGGHPVDRSRDVSRVRHDGLGTFRRKRVTLF